ncbi:hypothetical protein GCG21_08825 [Pseudactinotalea sp. HY160]|uniref:MucR family transcriptional regulator n=1 Tax=Pseudactinotalea sp. HY160 TaxID=2654490 RepID=UPI00128B19BF|nr:MucR family transcriptional regulator [Pseudactinotalea sp. HY160]MPV50108.1 hypothetical protein [Pseudactinotalea sp. HY160]
MSSDEPALITRREAAELLGYSPATLATYMSRDPDAWPRPVGRRGRGSANLYDRDEFIAAAQPAHATGAATGEPAAEATGESADQSGRVRIGSSATISDEDGLITCLDCGHRARNLTPHLRHVHAVTAREYRAAHRLPATGSMLADGVRERASIQRRAAYEADPSSLDHLTPFHGVEWTSAAGREAADSIRETSGYETVRTSHAPGRRAGVEAMLSARLDKLTAQVRQHGYETVWEAVEATRGLTGAEAAHATGLSASTIRRWRTRD